MATIQPTYNNQLTKGREVVVATWTPMTFSGSDVGSPISLAEYSDKTFQVFGTLGAGGTMTIEGSNDGVNWASLSNRQGTAMAFTTLSLNTSQDRPAYVRPRVTAGDGTTSLTVVVACHRTDLSGIG